MTTRPGEIARIRELAGGDEYRAEVLTALAVLQERSEHQTEWMREHDRRDDERFGALERRVSGVSSNVSDFKELKDQAIGAKKLLLGTVAIVAALGGCILFVLEVLKFAGKGAP